MDLLWLQDFVALAIQKNFSRAAEERNVSQPAFSRRIRSLENGVGVALINRQTLPLSLTPAGEVFLSQAEHILQTFADTVDRCHTLDAAGQSVIRFATSQSIYLTHYKTHLAPLVDQGGVDIDLNSTSWAADQFVTALQQNYCDVILTYWHPAMDFLKPLEGSKYDYITISKDKLVPVSRTIPLAGPEYSLNGTKRRSIPMLSYGQASALNSAVSYILRQQITPTQLNTVNQNALAISVKAMILEGFGMGWLPTAICEKELASGTLSICGDERFYGDLEVRLYKDQHNEKEPLTRLWREIELLHSATPTSTDMKAPTPTPRSKSILDPALAKDTLS
ncbi:MAG: LysR family transcriptional regulator [Halocynthiibacter sp.]